MSKTWFITGASSGFGREITHLALARGDRVAATVRNTSALVQLQASYPDHLFVHVLDVDEPDAITRVVNNAFDVLGQVDIVVSNAGYALFGASEEVSDAQIERQFLTNLLGSIRVIRAVIPRLRELGGGRIVQIASMLSHAALPTMGVYAASKWGIEGFLEGTIPEIAPFGIEVTMVEPGASRTNFAGSSADGAPPMAVYESTAVGDFRRFVTNAGLDIFPGDPLKIASAIVASTDQYPAPRRLTLGSDAFVMVKDELTKRLAALEAQKALALSTDVSA